MVGLIWQQLYIKTSFSPEEILELVSSTDLVHCIDNKTWFYLVFIILFLTSIFLKLYHNFHKFKNIRPTTPLQHCNLAKHIVQTSQQQTRFVSKHIPDDINFRLRRYVLYSSFSCLFLKLKNAKWSMFGWKQKIKFVKILCFFLLSFFRFEKVFPPHRINCQCMSCQRIVAASEAISHFLQEQIWASDAWTKWLVFPCFNSN